MRRGFVAALVAVGVAIGLPEAATSAGRCGEAPARPWCETALDPDVRAGLLLEALTPDERIGLLAGDELTGVAGAEGTHTGTSDGVPRVGLPTTFFSDGPVGPRQGMSTAMPSPMSLASTFSGALAEQHAAVVGDEAKKKGNDVVFAPAVNMLRTPLNGRTFEYFGEDPYLTGRMAFSWTRGLQAQGVIGNVKHFAVNNQEGAGPSPPGSPLGTAVIGGRLTVDARVDERTLREIYTPQFEQAVRAGVGTVMCAYPRVNGQYACENEHLLNDILRRDFGFKGFVLTDYGAAKNTGPSLNNGLDLDIWPGVALGPAPVAAAIGAGLTSPSQVDRSVRRVLRTLFAFGFFDRAAYVDDGSRIDKAGHHQIAGSLEEQGTVLLKNAGGLLPLDPDAEQRVAVIGPEATVLKNGGGSSAIVPFTSVTPLAGIQARVGAERVSFDDGSDPARAAAVARAADVAVVVVGDRSGEGADKPDMGLHAGQIDGVDRDALVAAVGAAQPRTAVVLQSGGPVLTPWRDAVPALLEAWFPGQNGGTAIARVLFGDAEPGGRLPATFPLREADEPVAGDVRRYPGVAERVDYDEGVLIGYRWFDARKLDVAYPFGHGLSYTSFAFSDLRLEPAGGKQDAVVSAVITNTGKRTGTAVPQLYLGLPEPRPGVTQPPLQLKGFDRVELPPGGRRRVRFPLDERAFSYWDTRADGWRVAPGCYGVAVGSSSRELALRGTIARGAACEAALTLPRDSRDCTSRRAFTITLPKGLRRAQVRVAGRRVRVRRGARGSRRAAGRLQARVDLRGKRSGRVAVRVTGRDQRGRAVRRVRVYRTCTARA